MSQPPEDRRRHPRLSLHSEVLLTIMIPEQTFSPNTVRGVAINASLSGLRVKTYQLSKADYTDLIKGVRYAKMELHLPWEDKPLPLRGKIVWVSFKDETAKDRQHVDLGIAFENLADDSAKRIEAAIARLHKEAVSTREST